VVHNDFTREVPPVIEFYSDRLSITSYGGLVEGLSVEEFFAGRSMPRNREIMRIYRDLDLVEQLGSGMNRILSAYSPDVFKISDNFLEVCFPIEGSLEFSKKGTPDEIPVKMAAAKKWGEKYGEKWGENEKAVLECMEQDRKVSILAISDKTGLSPSGVEKILSRFKKRGILRRIGPAKGGYWEIGKTEKESIPLPEPPLLSSYIRRPQ
jgi:predicted HTH transcriptional regulator